MSEPCAGCGRDGAPLLPGAPCWCPVETADMGRGEELAMVAELAKIICAHGRISTLGMQELLDWIDEREPIATPPSDQEREEFFALVRDVQYQGMMTGTFEQGRIWDAVQAIVARSGR